MVFNSFFFMVTKFQWFHIFIVAQFPTPQQNSVSKLVVGL